MLLKRMKSSTLLRCKNYLKIENKEGIEFNLWHWNLILKFTPDKKKKNQQKHENMFIYFFKIT